MSCGVKTVDLDELREQDFQRYVLFTEQMDHFFDQEHPGKLQEGYKAKTLEQGGGSLSVTYIHETEEPIEVVIKTGCGGCGGCG
jgi:hypothetical protein